MNLETADKVISTKNDSSNLLNYQTPAEFLRNIFLDRKSRNTSYSTRAFARDLAISQSLLSLIMNGKRSLTVKQATKMSLLLELPKNIAEKFIYSSVIELPENSISLKHLKDSKHKDFEIERFKTLGSWYHVAILDLTTTKDFKENSVWISRRLGISPIEVTDALSRLISLGLLERIENQLIKTNNRIYFATKRSEPAVRKFHKQMISKAIDQLELTDDVSFQARQISSMTMAIPKQLWPEAQSRIQKFQQELAAFLGQGECDEVYQMNIQMFPLTQKVENKKLKYQAGEANEN